jgi:hypothetical protein
MKLYTALDVSLRSVAICVVDEGGDVRHEAKVEADVDRIVACLQSLSMEIKVVGFEAGTLTQYLTYGLNGLSHPTAETTTEISCVDEVWEKPHMSAALPSAPQSEAPRSVRPMRAAYRLLPVRLRKEA